RRDLLRMAVLGLFGHGIFQVCFALGIARTTAANTSLLLALSPIVVALIAAGIKAERLLARAWIGVLASFGGVAVLVLGSGNGASLGLSGNLGDLLILIGAVSWAIFTVMARPMLRRYSSLQLNFA